MSHADTDAVVDENPVPPCPNGLFDLTGGTLVEDADEEVMELYMHLATTPSTGGLGFLDARQSKLEFDLVIPSGDPPSTKHKRARRDVVLPVVVQQDLTLLKGRGGDTGSVLWRSSLHLARHLLGQYHFPPPRPLLDSARLATARVLELGSGTGLLATLLAPLCAEYVASDRYENLRLLHRNIELNRAARTTRPVGSAPVPATTSTSTPAPTRIAVEEVDWLDKAPLKPNSNTDTPARPYDLILAVDCIFNEELVKPLVATLGKYCPVGSSTVAWVVVELRSSDVLTAFLEAWLTDPTGGWVVVRLEDGAMGTWDGVRAPWVGWVAWRA